MKTFAIRLLALPLLASLALSTTAFASDKADCTAALKSAQADKASGSLTKALTELATCSRPVCPKAMQKQCTELSAAVAASQPSVVFSAKDASGNPVTSVTVTVDGSIVASTLDGKPVPVDPGSHSMKFESDGATPVEKQISVDPETKGQTVAIDLDVNPPKAISVVKAPAAAAGDEAGSMWDTSEDPTKRYYFIGLRYRGDIVPKFMIDLFVNGGQTIFTNAISLEADLRHDNFSLIPAITYADYSTGNMLFLQNNEPATDPGYWSVVNSSLKAIYLSADLLWSVHIANHWDFEYGAEFGLGFIFGTLETNWVYATNGGQVSPTNYTACTTASQMAGKAGCEVGNHSGATAPGNINGHLEPSWVNGGSKPNIFPMVNFPQVGVRYKPMKQLESRIGIGFSLTGFWFGISADYGLEQPKK